FLEDTTEAITHCRVLIAQHKFSYRSFYQTVLPQICEAEDLATQAEILQSLVDSFEGAEKVELLTDLSFFYDKKLFNSKKLHETYLAIKEIDPTHIKSLRYFKLHYAQNEQWHEVAKVLQLL